MQTNQPLVALLNDLLRASASLVDPAIETALGRICALVQLKEAAVYLRSDDASFGLACRSPPNGPGLTATLPENLSADLVARWLMDAAAPQPMAIPDDGRRAENADPDQRPPAGPILVQMLDAGQISGLVAYGGAGARPVLSESQLELLQFATEILGTVLSRRRAEMRLIETVRQQKALLAALQDQMFEVDDAGRLTGLIAGPAHLVFAPPQQLAGTLLTAAVPGVVAGIVGQAFTDVMETGAVAGVRYRLDVAGEARHFELAGSRGPASQPDGRAGVVFLVRDVTGDAHLRDDLLRLGKIVESMDNLVAIIDAQLCVVWVNATFETHTGWRLDEIRGKPLGALLRSPESDPATIAQVNAAIEHKTAFKGQMVNQDRHGNRYWVDFNILPLFDAEGGLQGYVSIETVVTPLKEQEIAMARLAGEAEAARIRLANAIEGLPDGVVIFDAEDRLVVVNSAYHRTFPDLAPDAVVGVKLQDLLRIGLEKGLFHGNASETEKQLWLQGRIADYRLPRKVDEVQLPDGRWLRRITSRTLDGGVIAVDIDVTARHIHIAALDTVNLELSLALAERDRAEHRMTDIIDGSAVGTWELDVANDRVHVGGRWGEILGLQTRSLTALTLSDFRAMVHPDDHAKLYRPNDFGPVPDHEIVNTEFRMRHRDGHWVWILSRGRVAGRGADGTPALIAGVHLDISEQKQLEHEIATSRAFLLQVMDTSISAIVVLDGSGGVSFANREAEHVLGMRRADAPATGPAIVTLMLERVAGGPLADDEMPVSLVRRARGPVRDIQYALLLPDGARRILSCNAAPLDMDSGGQSLVVMSFSDITDDLAATVRLEAALSRAEEMSRAKSTFLANMSHEIRTPLNGVLGMAEVLANSVSEPAQRRMIDTIRKSGETLLTVLNGILDMSKIEAGKMVLESTAFLPADLIRQVEAIYAVAAEEKGIAFEVLISAGSDKPRLGDPHRLMQILNNLLNNAIKFTEAGSVKLKLSCRSGSPVMIEVSDTGVGMEPSQLSRVFESFEQADGSMTRRFGGTGLGLSIARQLATLMGGDISAESTPGHGSRFRVTLPLPETALQQPASMSAVAVAGREDALVGVRILGADDNATNRMVLAEMLAKTGAVLTQVENGQEAVATWTAALAKSEPFALLLLDITMPVLDGISALAEIRSLESAHGLPAVPAIAITAHAMPHQVADYIIGGFDTHLAKPFRQRDLLHALHSLLQT